MEQDQIKNGLLES